ncbi:MAG: GerMN domain-containing protein [SAR202 cluster bacterium]|jgi:spore germination protein GerM|nr:GerMN domain-containing protein [SAR202 cluster bacterium]|tara:strand:- start:10522 stop:11106 length:585 start_codon:yes stop_codon:yes gene_type:complete
MGGVAVAGTIGAWLLFVTLPDVYDEVDDAVVALPSDAPAEPAPLTSATLFYVAEDGERLIGVEREVVDGDAPITQARHVLEAQFQSVEPPLLSAMPEGTLLRAIYVTDQGDAFVDVSREITSGHTGGSLDELLTVYTIVNAVTVNVPTVRAVQILIEGREADTLAGHVDLRRPLTLRPEWTEPAPDDVGTPTAP